MKTKNKNILLILSLLIFAACGSKDSIRVNNGNPRKVNNTSNSIVSSYLAGDGSINDPFLIQNIEHLQNITRNIEDWDKHFRLVEDINAQGVIMEPIGAYNFETGEEISFRGSFDGQGHTINNLAIDQSDRKLATALFASTDGAIIQNLNLENVQIKSESFAGVLVGNSKNTDIVGISLTGNVECMDAIGTHCGGVVGNYITEGETNTVSNITTDVTVTGTDLIAGFIAKVKSKDAASLNIQNINTSSVVSSGIETSEAQRVIHLEA